MSGQTRGAKIVVLGAGMVGSAIAADLCRDHQVSAVDADRNRVEALATRHPLTPQVADLADADAVKRVIRDADLVIGAVPGFMGYATLRTVIEAGKNVVDISFFDEDPFTLDALAQERGVTAVMDCGVAPGLSNMVLGYHANRMTVAEFRCLVGGLPARRSWPWQYKAPFSPIDVLEEYTRPARLVENGLVVTKPALSDPELVEVQLVGTLEAFNTDGLRTLLKTVAVPNMTEKTLRYPGHIEYVRVLRESGFLDKEPVLVGGASVRPIDVAAALLFPRWRLVEGEEELTTMQIAVRGQDAGADREVIYRLFDRTDAASGTSSMARATGYTCTAVARLVLEGRFARKGICPPEYVGADAACFDQVLTDLRSRGVIVERLSSSGCPAIAPEHDAPAGGPWMNSQPGTLQPAEAGLSHQTPNESGAAGHGDGRLALINGRIALSDRIVEGRAVVVEGDAIFGLAALDELDSGIERLDVGGRLITPGLIDIHIHGALGHTFNEPNAAAWEIILRENARRGVTSLLATFAPEPIPNLARCFDFCREWMANPRPGTRVLGAHLESPYVSLAQKGALDPTAIRTPDDGSVEPLLAYADILRIFVLAPELPGALALIERLAGLGIMPAAGHTSATDEQVAGAMRAGLRHVTHIWSAMSSTVRHGPWRKPGVLEAALVYDGLTVEMIADNRHLPYTLMKLATKCIGSDRLCAVSDATNGAGLPDGTRYRMGSMEYEVGDGVGMMLDNTAFAGSTTLLNQMIPILNQVVGIPLVEAIRMVTLTPARTIGEDASIGSIAPGRRADIAVFDDDFSAWRVMIGGRWASERSSE